MKLIPFIISIFLFIVFFLMIYEMYKDKEERTWKSIRKGQSIKIKNKEGKCCRKIITDKGDDRLRLQHFGDMSKEYFLSHFIDGCLTIY